MPGSGGTVLDDDTRDSDAYASDDPTDGFTGEAGDLLEDPTGYIREVVLGIVVGGVLSVLLAVVRFGLDIVSSTSSALASAGGAIRGNVVTLQRTTTEVVVLPIEVMEPAAASSGFFAPLVAAGTFALVAAIAAGLIWGTFRLVRFL